MNRVVGLPLAIKAHTNGDLPTAETHYKRAYEQGTRPASLFMNYGALLRALGKVDESELLYEEGLRKYPDHMPLLNNYCNLIRDKKPATAIRGYVNVLKYRIEKPDDISTIAAAYSNIAEVLRRLELYSLSKDVLRTCIKYFDFSPDILRNLLLLHNPSELSALISPSERSDSSIISCILDCINTFPPIKRSALHFAVAVYRLSLNQTSEALEHFRFAQSELASLQSVTPELQQEAQELIDIHSWNFACTLLKQQHLTEGWKLYEFGLRTPAAGPQKWQRALKKPFSSSQIHLWRGEPLVNKSILLLEEQGIGDGMMFLTLVPKLLQEARLVGISVSSRLFPIYKRSFADFIDNSSVRLYTPQDFAHNRVDPSLYDYQSPVASICQHRFTDIKCYAPLAPILKADVDVAKNLRLQYLDTFRLPSTTKIIGISWRGGGRPDRITQKSFDFKKFTSILSPFSDCLFVSLQYGKVDQEIEFWTSQGIRVVYDPNINPLKNMEAWLNQVSVCDAVISVANTTIHGAGGLNIPTLCLLGSNPDWRWFDDPLVTRSYWYPSVGITRQTNQGDWSPCISDAVNWLRTGANYPTGLVSTNVV